MSTALIEQARKNLQACYARLSAVHVPIPSELNDALAMVKRADDGDGEWVTINGVHVFIGKDGTIEKGPKGFVGKTPSQLSGGKEPSAQVQEAIKAYTAAGGPLASQYPMSADKQDALEKYVAGSKLNEPTTIYRGFWLKDDAAVEKWFGAGNTEVGHENEVKGLTSFTKDSIRAHAYGQGGVVFVEQSVRATSGADISKYSIYPEEKEVLQFGMRWEVTSSRYEGGTWYVSGKEK